MAKLKKKSKYFIFKSRDFWLVIAVLVYGFYSGLFGDLINPISPPAYLEIDYGSKKRAFEGDVSSDMFLLDALLAASRAGGFEIRYALLGDRADIMKIEGFTEDGLDGRWYFYLNQREVAADEIHKIKIKPGDRILAKFE